MQIQLFQTRESKTTVKHAVKMPRVPTCSHGGCFLKGVKLEEAQPEVVVAKAEAYLVTKEGFDNASGLYFRDLGARECSDKNHAV